MTSSRQMTREELIKLAALDVYGLLDEIEAELYSRSFREASVAVQDEIVALQARLAVDPTFLSTEEPSPALREKVIDRVLEAIQLEQAELAPLATIGRGRNEQDGSASEQGVRRTSSSGALLFWRAACFMLLAAIVVVLYMYSEAVRDGRDILAIAIQNQTEKQLRNLIGPDYEDFLANPNVDTIVFNPVDRAASGQASLYVNKKTNSVFLLGMGLRDGGYKIQVRLEDGTARELRDFDVAPNRITGLRLDSLAASVIGAISWEIVDRGSGLVVLAT